MSAFSGPTTTGSQNFAARIGRLKDIGDNWTTSGRHQELERTAKWALPGHDYRYPPRTGATTSRVPDLSGPPRALDMP
jgi:hypothetical protein